MDKMGKEESRSERIQTDNEYLKMKLMIERGAQFRFIPGAESVPPEVENRFLRDILEFESLNENKAFIEVFEKLGRPSQFVPVDQITDDHIEQAWRELVTCLTRHQITVGVCTPNVGIRELYRFVTEELFRLHISSVDMPGLVHGFIYDEFHPDPLYDNPRSSIEGFIEPLFQAKPFSAMHFFRRFDLRLNDQYPLSQRQFMNLVNHFKNEHKGFHGLQVKNVRCSIEDGLSVVDGTYEVSASRKDGAILDYSGSWQVSLSENPATGVWDISSVQVDGISF